MDEFHNYLVNPRAKVHVLMTLDEESYKHNLNVLKEGAWERGFNDLMGDHPISWCHNFEGGRAWFQGLGHNRELWHDPTYLEIVLGGIQTAAGILPANCTSYTEVANLISSYRAEGAITAAAATELQGLLIRALEQYLAKDPKAAAKHLVQLEARATTLIANRTVRTAITNKANDLVAWMKSIE